MAGNLRLKPSGLDLPVAQSFPQDKGFIGGGCHDDRCGSLRSLFAALFATAAQAEIKTEWVEYSHDGVKLKGYLAYDDAITGKRPGVLMVHRRDGMTALTLKNTEMYAKMGYVAFAPDIFGYGHGVLPKDVPEMIAQMSIYTKDRALMRSRTQAGLDVLLKKPRVDASHIALVGYCMGGMIGVEMIYAGVPMDAMVSIHGSFKDHPVGGGKNIKGTRVLIEHGAEDKPAPLHGGRQGAGRASRRQDRV